MTTNPQFYCYLLDLLLYFEQLGLDLLFQVHQSSREIVMQTMRTAPEPVYIGSERRKERRRRGNNTFEKLLSGFGLNRRIESEQRDMNSSWLLLSETSLSA